ncbi:hypothetical protein B0H10DRAFT_2282851 [Mycena sp. CBHHK59/15]|nr:hypothetical protein B0H10DRAFT_2282851 [Mycena sp. CBHHK59/15]
MWYEEVKVSLKETDDALGDVELMLILGVRARWSSTHQMLRMWFIFLTMLMAVHWTIEMPSTPLCTTTGNFGAWSCQMQIGVLLKWSLNGSRFFVQLPPRCPARSVQCSPPPTQYFVDCKTICDIFYEIYPTRRPPGSSAVSSRLIASLVIITTSPTTLPITHGPLISIPESRTKDSSVILPRSPNFWLTSSNLPTSPNDISRKNGSFQMSSTLSSSFIRRISRLATRFNGGLRAAPSFLGCIDLPVMFFQSQDLPSPWSAFSLGSRYYIPPACKPFGGDNQNAYDCQAAP